ncbi:MAG: adenylyltransferase/cytidyltransferase family protein [Kangiellaceae bacterium]|nr:adenylyltransferase/cytidyltransferase family protein [Kangiellaceae bacterium]MCW9000586.1 adenylyltransferase/cytidyltransferase family protein [Kangiellaceae bacterium]
MSKKNDRRRVAVIGSAFNPPHLGHKDVIEQIYRDFDEILLVPSYRHAFGKKMVPFEHRLYMASMMGQCFHNENYIHYLSATPILTSDIERRIGDSKPGAVYTYDVLSALEQNYQNAGIESELTFIVGPDNACYETWNKFYRGDEILERWKLRSVSERIPVHSTQIRNLISEFPRPAFLFETRFKKYLDGTVANYIFNNKLYGVYA